MKITLPQLKRIIAEEVSALAAAPKRAPRKPAAPPGRRGMMLEGHVRITPEEMHAWMGGDWGYVAEGPERGVGYENVPGYEGEGELVCPECDPDFTVEQMSTAERTVVPCPECDTNMVRV